MLPQRKHQALGDNQKEILEDIAVLTGATFISKDLGMDLKDVTLEKLGGAGRVVVQKTTRPSSMAMARKKRLLHV